MVKRYSIAGIHECTPAGFHDYVMAHDYDALAALLRRMRPLLHAQWKAEIDAALGTADSAPAHEPDGCLDCLRKERGAAHSAPAARAKGKAPPDHEWDENGKCKWCPAETVSAGEPLTTSHHADDPDAEVWTTCLRCGVRSDLGTKHTCAADQQGAAHE